jgi:tetratricopeptide (TPR) repeat protein
MFTKPDSCPVCYAPWFEHEKKCLSCGSIAELFYERSMPDRDKVDIAKIEKNVSRVRKYLVDHENHGLARYTLGLSYANLGFLPEGLVEIKRAAQLLPEKVQISYEAVALAAKQGDFSQDSLDQIDRVIERKPDFKEALYLKGIILRESGKLPAAARAMQDAYKLDENYVHAQMELKSFIQEKESLLRDPRIASSIPRKGLPQNAVDYLHVITTAIPVPPPRLGKTSMTVLAAISGNKANLMRKMYSEDLRQYETAVDRRVKQTEALEEDFIALSELCIRATATGSRLARDDRRRAALRPMAVASSEANYRLSIPERSAILDAEVQRYQKQGYMLVARTETTAQLSKKHEFDCCLAFFLVLIVIGIILYLLYYLVAKKEYLIFIEVDERGRIHRTSS